MDGMAATMLSVMIVLLLLGFPFMIPLIGAAMLGFFVFFAGVGPDIMIQLMIAGIRPAVLVAVPMFIFAADIITKGHSADRLLDLVTKCVGHVRGGLAVTSAVTCTLFGAASGFTQATVAAIGGPLRPRMLQAGYPDAFVMALTINASDVAFLIPPSIGMIVYAVISGTSIGELFIAGIGPALLILVMFAAYSVVYAKLKDIPIDVRASWPERRKAMARAIWPLGFPVIILGGIYGGVFTPTEAASVSVLYALILELLVFRSIKISEIPGVALSTSSITAVLFILLAAGSAFAWTLSFAQIPQAILGGLGLDEAGPMTVLIAISIAFFVGCMFVDALVVILVLTPVFAPAVAQTGLDPVHVGIVIILQVAIGSATPPFGADIFTAVAIFRRPYFEVIKGTPPFLLMLLVAAVLVICVPDIALFLRDLAFSG